MIPDKNFWHVPKISQTLAHKTPVVTYSASCVTTILVHCDSKSVTWIWPFQGFLILTFSQNHFYKKKMCHHKSKIFTTFLNLSMEPGLFSAILECFDHDQHGLTGPFYFSGNDIYLWFSFSLKPKIFLWPRHECKITKKLFEELTHR